MGDQQHAVDWAVEYKAERDEFEAQTIQLRGALEKCRDELLGADQHVPSETWKQGIRDAIEQAEKALGVE